MRKDGTHVRRITNTPDKAKLDGRSTRYG